MAKRKKDSPAAQARLKKAGLGITGNENYNDYLRIPQTTQESKQESESDILPGPTIAEFKSTSPVGEGRVNTTEVESTIDNSLNQIGEIVTRLQMDLAGRAAGHSSIIKAIQQSALSSLIYKTASARQAVDDSKMKVVNAMEKRIGKETQPIVDVQEKIQPGGNDEVVGAAGQDNVEGVAAAPGKWSVSIPGGPNPADWSTDAWPVWQSPTSGRYIIGQLIPATNPPANAPSERVDNGATLYINRNQTSYYGCSDGSTPRWVLDTFSGAMQLACDGPPPDDSGIDTPPDSAPIENQPENDNPPLSSPPKLDMGSATPQATPKTPTSATPPVCTPPKPKKPDCEEVQYNVYCTEGGIPYILKKGDSPHASTDKLIDSGTPSTSWVNSILNCAKKDCEQPKLPSQGLILPGTRGGEEIGFKCDMGKGLSFHSPSFDELMRAIGLNPTAEPASFLSIIANAGNPTGWLNLIREWVSWNFRGIKEIATQLFACPDVLYASLGVKAIPMGILNGLSQGALNNELRLNEYARNQQCQTILPTGPDAIAAWLAGEFSLADAECIFKSNGQRVDWASRIAIASRTKWTPLESVSMYRRGILTADEYTKSIRSNGYIYDDDSEKIWELSKQIPVIQDIVRFMVRDTDDPKVVGHFGLDAQFDEKYGKQLKKWGEEQGIDSNYARYMWRAHWSIPSPTQLYDMYRRLRWNKDQSPNNEVVEDIRTALVQQDILPFWIDRLLELATLPLTRTDAKRAFMINAIDRDRLWMTFVHGGYSDDDATTLTEFVEKEKTLRFGRHPATKRYSRGEISTQELEKILTFEGAKQNDVDNAKSYAKLLTRSASRTACKKAITRRYMLGELDFADLIPKYNQLGIDPEISSMLATEAECERSARGKRVPLMTLSKWYKAGVIEKVNLAQRMTALQFSWEEIQTTIDFLDNELDIRKKREDEMKDAKKAAADKKKQLEDQRKAAREQAKATAAAKEMQASMRRQESEQKAAQSAEKRESANMDKQLKAANAAKNRMEDYMLKIAEGLVKALQSEMGPSLRFAKNTFNNIASRTNQSREDILRIGIATLADKSIRSTQDFADRWYAATIEGSNFPGDDSPTT